MTDADDALKALRALGWHPGYEPKGIKNEDCVFLYADSTLLPGVHRRERLKTELPIVTSGPVDPDEVVVTEGEYAVAWRLNERRRG